MSRSLYSHGFVRVAAAVPHVSIGDPAANAQRTLALAHAAHDRGAAVVLFPELGLSGYSGDDLFHQSALLDGVEAQLARLIAASAGLRPLILVGAPLRAEGGLFNCAVAVHGGRALGVVPKSYVPEYHEYYEKRQFRAARDLVGDAVMIRAGGSVAATDVPAGPDLVFACANVPGLAVHVEICEDVWSPLPPSTYGALAGATVLTNLSASNITIGKAGYRRMLASSQSARTVSAYAYAAAGRGESTTDMAWDGQAMICENGDLLAESERFATDEQLIVADVDLDRLLADRMQISCYGDTIGDLRKRLRRMRRVEFALELPTQAVDLERRVERFPYVPANPASRDDRCREVYSIQVAGLETRLRATGIEKIVIGVSGGLDSTHALTVAARVVDRLGLPRAHVLGYTLPGFATSERTRGNAHALMEALGVTAAELDIRPSARQMLHDIGHPAADGAPEYDITYENVQAGERTSHLFRLANHHRALVLGTGDLSELALGWSTYGVGDQMSHYNVNASVPKTLIRFLLRWAIGAELFSEAANRVLSSVLETAISPELVPGDGDGDGDGEGEGEGQGPHQDSERTVGPYELQDFFLYYVLRFGYRPSKVAYLAEHAWASRDRGEWPDLIPPEARNEYPRAEIRHWLQEFLRRFFETSQFKRSALPNAPKVGSGGSLSPRADWRAPSDGNATAWLAELDAAAPAD
ncbi:MAG: NAD(+) synthase [Solirubrobacterales bacterium]|nr:NAD(+) synthase [Solirubrobacterales bacterium]